MALEGKPHRMSGNKRYYPARWWWLCLAAILLFAAFVRYTGYNFSLPYIDHPDEPDYVIAARFTFDTGSPKPIGMQGYPPGIIAIYYFIIKWFFPQSDMLNAIPSVRLLSITVSLFTLIVIALVAIAWRRHWRACSQPCYGAYHLI